MRRSLFAPCLALAVGCGASKSGPKPDLVTVAPALVCDAQRAVNVTLSGTGFSPLVIDALTTPKVLMPVVTLTPTGGATGTVVPPEGVSLPTDKHDGTTLAVQIPAGFVPPLTAAEPAAIYDVTVANADGHADTLAMALTVLPPPQVDAVTPIEICSAIMSTFKITGLNFRPGATVTIGTTPATVLSGAAVTVVGATEITVSVAKDLLPPGGPYDVTVTNPEEGSCSATKPAALTVEPPPTLTKVDPNVGAAGTLVPVTLTGTTFLPGMTVTLDATPAVTSAASVASRTSATATFDLTGVAPGTYGVTVKNADGCSVTLPAAFTVTDAKVIKITSIDPPFGCTCERTVVTIKGSGFVSTPAVKMRLSSMPAAAAIRWERVAFIDAGTLTAVVPNGAAVGTYDVTIDNPPSNGATGTLAMGFRVVMNPVPRIFNVDPGRGSTSSDTPVTITGANFRNPVKVELLGTTGAAAWASGSIVPGSATDIMTTIPTSTIAEGVYLVRVTDLDEGTYSTYSFFVVKNPSAKLSTFGAGLPLTGARRELGAALAVDDLGNKYIYAVGGADASGAALDTAEVSALSKFGDLSAWHAVPTKMGKKRRGVALVAVPVFKSSPMGIDRFVPERTYLYAIGGRDGSVEKTVERAVVLRNADAPVASGTVEAGGTLGAGTWYYKVTALLAAGDPDNPGGETLSSDEVIVSLSAAGTVKLTWPTVTVNAVAAAKYRIYRTDAADGVSQAEHLIDETTATTYSDTGKGAGTVSFPPAGSTGVWVTSSSQLGTARFGASAVIAADPAGARYVYALGGRSATTGGLLRTAEVASLDATGALGAWSGALVDGTATPADMIDSRAYAGADIENKLNVSTFAALPATRIWIGGGVGQVGGAGGVGALVGLEFADVKAGGTLTAWAHQMKGGASVYDISNAAGPFFAISSDQLFSVGGAGTAGDMTFGSIQSGPGDKIDFGAAGALTGAASSSSNGPPSPLGLGGTVRSTGLLFCIGGTSDGTNAVTTTFRVLN